MSPWISGNFVKRCFRETAHTVWGILTAEACAVISQPFAINLDLLPKSIIRRSPHLQGSAVIVSDVIPCSAHLHLLTISPVAVSQFNRVSVDCPAAGLLMQDGWLLQLQKPCVEYLTTEWSAYTLDSCLHRTAYSLCNTYSPCCSDYSLNIRREWILCSLRHQDSQVSQCFLIYQTRLLLTIGYYSCLFPTFLY